MSQERTSVSKEGLGSLRSCLMEGSANEQKGARKVRRRALIASIIVQILVLATLVMYPILSRGERLAATVCTIVPPYSYSGGPARPMDNNTQPGKTPTACRFCVPPHIPPTIVTVDHGNPAAGNDEPTGPGIPGAPVGPNIPGAPLVTGPSRGPEPPREPLTPVKKPRISLGHIEAAALVHRVEPIYPKLPLQMHREGRVELHAIIATDGSIQALEVVSGDPLFYASALAAVREWRYRPTFLDGQAVEVDTQISVLYILNH
ncbi:MAG TPA: TonB family protein [Candidatus Acidoferrum sp.]|nr:TonB family protein [Candidatus Acidoferrum sp.]